jgi:hypothetical protein
MIYKFRTLIIKYSLKKNSFFNVKRIFFWIKFTINYLILFHELLIKFISNMRNIYIKYNFNLHHLNI